MLINVYIWKYLANNLLYDNYFYNRPPLIDKIWIHNVAMDGIPIYNETIEKSDEILEFVADSFQVKLSLLQPDKSINGSDIKSFLFPLSNRNIIFIAIVEFGDSNNTDTKRIGGRIEVNSIQADLTQINNNYDITFKLTGLIKELSVLQDRTVFTPYQTQDLTLDQFISGCLVPDNPQPTYFAVRSYLDWINKLGYAPKLIHKLYNNVVSNNAVPSKWAVFKDLARNFGFMYKMSVLPYQNIFREDYPPFIVETFWRSAGLTPVTVQQTTDIENYSDLAITQKYLLMLYRTNILGDSKQNSGVLMDCNGNVWVADGSLLSGAFEEINIINDIAITVINGQNTPPVATCTALLIQPPTFVSNYMIGIDTINPNLFFKCQFSFASMFCKNYQIIRDINFPSPGQSRFNHAIRSA